MVLTLDLLSQSAAMSAVEKAGNGREPLFATGDGATTADIKRRFPECRHERMREGQAVGKREPLLQEMVI